MSSTEAESKRLVLAFESRQLSELNWALNTLALFSCNTLQNFMLDTQPYLLESMSNYMLFIIENIESFNYEDPMQKRENVLAFTVPTLIDA